MWNRVVDMQEVELMTHRHFGHTGGEREAVGRVLEQRVAGDLDLMVVNVGSVEAEPDGIRVADKVDFVAAPGELESKFCCDDATAAVCGVTGDSDFHWDCWFDAVDGEPIQEFGRRLSSNTIALQPIQKAQGFSERILRSGKYPRRGVKDYT
jgi:hypothetical protein